MLAMLKKNMQATAFTQNKFVVYSIFTVYSYWKVKFSVIKNEIS